MTVVTPRVLVVSESRITRRVAEATFADQQVELMLASSGQQGLEAWAAHPAAVVVVDLAMEPPDGLTVAQRVAMAPTPPAVIALAGQNDAVDEDAVADAGVRALLRKPLDSKQLMEAVRSALREPQRATEHPATAALVSDTEPATAPWSPAPMAVVTDDDAMLAPPVPPAEALERWGLASSATPEPVAADASSPGAVRELTDDDLERVSARVMALWTASVAGAPATADRMVQRAEQLTADSASAAVERVAPQAAAAAAERLVRELAPKVVAEVARLVVADVSERLVREEIARLRSAHAAR